VTKNIPQLSYCFFCILAPIWPTDWLIDFRNYCRMYSVAYGSYSYSSLHRGRSRQRLPSYFQANLYRFRPGRCASRSIPLRSARNRSRSRRRRLRPEAASLRPAGRSTRQDHARDDYADGRSMRRRRRLLLRRPSVRLRRDDEVKRSKMSAVQKGSRSLVLIMEVTTNPLILLPSRAASHGVWVRDTELEISTAI